MSDVRRGLPPVHAVLDDPGLSVWIERRGREVVVEQVRETLAQLRAQGRAAGIAEVVARVAAALESDRAGLRRVINATGILIHTGLGRAPLGAEIARQVAEAAERYCALEFDLDSGTRGRRATHVAQLLADLTGAEAAVVVNNNAAATLLTLRVLAAGREVIVSRGQLIEIGGSYRLPDVFEASGARLREVGTTNKTRLSDYSDAIQPSTAGLLRVHASNFRIVGFTEEVAIGALAALAHDRGLWCVDDIGSGALAPGLPPGIGPREPTIRGSLAAGADLVLCSGDKLLGGPQCGLILGRADLIAQISVDPMMRALRVDKLTLAALEAVLRLARSRSQAVKAIPLWSLLATPVEQLDHRGQRLAARWNAQNVSALVTSSEAYLGGGTTPDQALPSRAVRLDPPFPGRFPTADHLARALRLGEPPVVARVHGGSVWLDLRSVFPDEDVILERAVLAQLGDDRPSTG
ncbi:MAG: L-seryl-tRNA(Sec) selenium transferase [Isosphaeraceae bacterium]|nr:MAG: L-seryl-tRNA(Sec) selenium transferase [Isosphaeraceae bacterium]